jgi:C1A family cysteine protease
MKTRSIRALCAVAAAAIIVYGCSKSSPEKTPVPTSPEETGTFMLPDGSHFMGCNFSTAEDLADVPVYHVKEDQTLSVLPTTYTLAHPPIGNQGQQGSCVGWGAATTDGIYYYYHAGLNSWTNTSDIMSASFVYNSIKAGSCNAGASIARAVKYLKSTGDCILGDMAYTDKSCSATPTAAASSNASLHKITSYAAIKPADLTTIKTVLSQNHPVIIGVQVDNNYERLNKTNYTWTPNSTTILGGHCNTIIGYDDSKQAFYVQNQWGTNWGNAGFYWISYSMMATNKVMEAYYVQ